MKRSSQCESLSVSSYSTWKIDILYRAVIRNNKILRKKHQRENIFFISSQINQKRPRFDNVNKVYFALGKTSNWMNKSILSLHSNLLKIVWIEIKSKSKIVWNLIRPKLRQKVPFPPFYCLQLTVIQWGVCTFSHKLYCKVFPLSDEWRCDHKLATVIDIQIHTLTSFTLSWQPANLCAQSGPLNLHM